MESSSGKKTVTAATSRLRMIPPTLYVVFFEILHKIIVEIGKIFCELSSKLFLMFEQRTLGYVGRAA
jgi:hypothetical protein